MKHFFPASLSLLLALVLAVANPIHAQTPTWQTVASVGGSISQVYASVGDAAGNVYITGQFTGTISLGNTTLVSVGGTDGFVAKYSLLTGGYVWGMRFGGTGADKGTALALAGTNVYVATIFGGSASFGNLSLTSLGGTDVAVLKLADQGAAPAVVWAQQGGSVGNDDAWALAVSGSSVYLGGNLNGPATFGSLALPLNGTGVLAAGFVAKLADAGPTATYAWVQNLGGSYYDSVFALAVDGTTVYAGGFFFNNVAFGGAALTSIGSSDALIIKLTDNGPSASLGWARQGGGTGGDQVNALAASGGTVYASGSFSGTAAFGTAALTSAGRADAFVAKLTDAGPTATYTWAQSAGGTGDDLASSLVVRSGSVYVAGGATGPATFGPGTLAGAGSSDAFVARLADAGPSARFIWVQSAGSSGTDLATTVTMSNNRLYVGGFAQLPATFGALVLAGSGAASGFLGTLASSALGAVAAVAPAVLAAFPNPVAARATVQVPAATATTALVLRDALGRAVAQGTGSALQVPALPAGVYVLQATGPGGAAAHTRLVVE